MLDKSIELFSVQRRETYGCFWRLSLGTLMPFPPGSGLKLGLLPEGHYTMVVFWTLNKYTVSNVLHIQPTLGC